MNVFLSYSTTDLAQVESARRVLQDAGHQVWMDRHAIPFGSSFTDGIERALERAQALLLFWSASAVESPWVRKERDAWINLLVKENRQAQSEGRAPRRFMLPIMLGDAEPPTLDAPLRFLRLPTDTSTPGWGDQLVEAVTRLGHAQGVADRGVETFAWLAAREPKLRPAAMLARRLLADLRPNELSGLAERLDATASVRCADSDAVGCREDLVALMARDAGPTVMALREAVLAVRSPFRPFDGTLDDWRMRPPRNWHAVADRVMTLGVAPRAFMQGPADLRSAALVQRNGIAFRNGCLHAEVWATLDDPGAVGLMLSCDAEGSGYVGIVRRTATGELPRLALLQLDGPAVIPLAESAPIPVQAFHPERMTMALCRRGTKLELRGAGMRLDWDGATGPGGEPGLVRFGPAAAHFYDLSLDGR